MKIRISHNTTSVLQKPLAEPRKSGGYTAAGFVCDAPAGIFSQKLAGPVAFVKGRIGDDEVGPLFQVSVVQKAFFLDLFANADVYQAENNVLAFARAGVEPEFLG